MKRRTAKEIQAAAEDLRITGPASLYEIRDRYRELMKTWHPDVAEADRIHAHRMTVRITESYGILVEYCMNHRFSFRPEDIRRDMEQSPAGYWMERFGDDPIWG